MTCPIPPSRKTVRASALGVCALVLAMRSHVQADPTNVPRPGLTGRWVITVDFFGTPQYLPMELTQQGDALTGTFDGDKLEGAVHGNTIHLLAKDTEGGTEEATGTLAGSTDASGVKRVLGGNPETGPFYVEGAMPGDTLVVHLDRVRLNRDWAISDDGIVPRGLDGNLATKMKDTGRGVRWRLDLAKGIATSERPGDHLARYTVPLHPMLGCVGVAPPPAVAAPPTQDSGSWGGNMDFNEVTEGATLYLPVRNPGALLYFGDGHAAQGDGELTGNALETSLDVQLTVNVIQGKAAPGVRLESATHLSAMGLDGSLDGAFRAATANMAAWLADDYNLTASEIAQVFGTAAEYRVSEVADRNAGIVMKISKERLRALAPAAK